MKYVKHSLKCLAIIAGMVLPVTANIANPVPVTEYSIELSHVTVTAKKIRKNKTMSFLGFRLQKCLDTSVNPKLKEALIEFKFLGGPDVRISSLVRHKWSSKSKHRCGKAVDFEFSHELIDWLVSEVGKSWMEKHGMTFFIEDVPGSKVLKPYLQDVKYVKYVFENPYATGPHIHLNI